MSLLLALLGVDPPVDPAPLQQTHDESGGGLRTRRRVVPGWALPQDPEQDRRNAAATADARTRRQLRALRLLRLI